MKVSKKVLKKIFPNANDEFVMQMRRLLNQYGTTFGIDSNVKLARFLGHVKHETMFRKGKLKIRENLNYRRSSLRKVSKKFRKNKSLMNKAMSLKGLKKQEYIANHFYANRLGNRGYKSGDGFRYRGQGILQITGRATHKKIYSYLEKKIGIVAFNKKGEVYKGLGDNITFAILTGMAYWHSHKMHLAHTPMETVNIINSGLPKSYKKQRVATIRKAYKAIKVG